MTRPKISVCIPTYNYARYLPEAIESVLSQKCRDFEILIIDDNSSDATREVVGIYAARDDRIRFLVNPCNIGMVANWNLCLEQARGEYIHYLFGDDLLASSDALELMAAVLDDEPDVSLVCSARNVVDEHSTVMEVWSNFSDGARIPGIRVIRSCLFAGKNLIGEPSVVMFKKVQAGRGFNPAYRQLVDLEMWFHLLEQGDFANLATPLSSFRVHDFQQSALNAQETTTVDDLHLLFSDYLDKSYLHLNGLLKQYLVFDICYRFWKSWKVDGKSGKAEAYRKIAANRSVLSFCLWFPFYKAAKPLVKWGLKFDRKSL